MFIPPTSVTVDVNDTILLPTLQASDLKVDGMPASTVTAVDGDTASFGVGFAHEYDGHYYVLTSGPMDWTQAESEAKSLGGHLVTVNSQAERFSRRCTSPDPSVTPATGSASTTWKPRSLGLGQR